MNELHSMRLRVFALLGMPVVSLAGACHSSGAAMNSATATSRPVDESRRRSVLSPTEWTVSRDRARPPGAFARPTCPSGIYCSTAPTANANTNANNSENPPGAIADGCVAVPVLPGALHVPAYGRVSYSADETQLERADGRAGACCYHWVIPCPGGRPLRNDAGALFVAPSCARDDWQTSLAERDDRSTERDRGPDASDELFAIAAAHWAREAAGEHGSIAAFSRIALELLALGAPPSLVAGAHRAALDEVEHARLAYGLASRFALSPLGPSALVVPPTEAPSFARFAVETLCDGCVGEGVAALVAAALIDECVDRDVAAVLARIAADEHAHAELAWSMLRWAVEQGDSSVHHALRAERDRLAAEPSVTVARDPARRGRTLGVSDAAVQCELREAMVRTVVLPALDLLLARLDAASEGSMPCASAARAQRPDDASTR